MKKALLEAREQQQIKDEKSFDVYKLYAIVGISNRFVRQAEDKMLNQKEPENPNMLIDRERQFQVAKIIRSMEIHNNANAEEN